MIRTLPWITPRDVGDAFADAFHDEPLATFLVPDPQQRRRRMADFFALVAQDAQGGGCVDVATIEEQLAAAALWFDLRHPDAAFEPHAPDERLRAALGPWAAERWHLVDTVMTGAHPRIPHLYLMLVGVVPDRQRQGYGTDLIRHRLKHLDRIGLPAYLEATTDRSRALYLRLGFRDHAVLHLPDGSPLWAMWRPPQ